MYQVSRENWVEYLVLSITIFITILFYASIISKDGLAVGIDAPYYMIQVREILRSGFMKYGDPPLIFYILSIFALLAGDIETGFILGVPILMALAALPFYYCVKEVTERRLPAYISLLLILYYPSYIRMLGDFVKNQFGILFIGLILLYLFKPNHGWRRYIYITIFTVLAGLTHILDFGISLIILGVYFIHDLLTVRREYGKVFIALSIPIAFYLAGYILLPFYFGDLGKGVSFVSEAVEAGAEPLLPMGPNIYLPALATVAAGGILLVERLYGREYRASRYLSILVSLGVFLIMPWEPKWMFRIMLMTFIPISLLTGYILSLVRDRLPLLLISILILSHPISIAFPLASRLHPTITPLKHQDLMEINTILNGEEAHIIFVGHPGEKYWIEYILDKQIYTPASKPNDPTTPLYLILPKNMKPPPNTKPIYRGEEYNLYRLFPR